MSSTSNNKANNYQKLVKERAPKSQTALMCFKAFIVGGIICCVGQLIFDFGEQTLKLSEEAVPAFTSTVMVFLGATLTGIGVYDKIGKFAGAGSIVPITGFANSVVAPAIEFKSEGFVLGVGAKLFSIAGPVLAYGISSSVLIGLLSMIFR